MLYRAATITESATGGNDLVVFRNAVVQGTYQRPAIVENVQVQTDFPVNAGNSKIFDTGGANALGGAGGNDTLFGFGSGDRLSGGDANDVLRGFAGTDVLTGSLGSDRLEGASGNEPFEFNAAAEWSEAAPDVIQGLDRPGASEGDRIDLATIDANTGVAGGQAFQFGGTGAGRVRLVGNGMNTELLANTDADAEAELRIVVGD